MTGRLLAFCVAWVVATTPLDASNETLRLPAPAFETATELWRTGHAETALADLDRRLPQDSPPPVEALVLRAKILTDLGRPTEAETLWTEVTERAVWMRTFARRQLVESLAGRGEPSRAAEILGALTRDGVPRHLDLVLRVGDAFRQTGSVDGARRHYGLVLDHQRRGQTADRARLGLAGVLEESGNLQAAARLLVETQRLHADPGIYQAARNAERRVTRRLGAAPATHSEDLYLQLVRRLRNASRHSLAFELIDEWETAHPSSSRLDRIAAERVATLYAERSNVAAVSACRQFIDRFGSSPLLADIHLTEFRLAVRMGDTARARRQGLALWNGQVASATSEQRRSAAELLAAYLVAMGHVDEGLDIYRSLFQAAASDDLQRSYLWRAGVAALRVGQHERALTNLAGLVRRQPTGDLAPAALYWRGVAETRSDVPAALRTFESVAARFPYHYYGSRARAQLGRLSDREPAEIPQPTTEFPSVAVAQGSTARAEYKAAMVLAKAGLPGDAAWYLRRLLDQRRGDRGLALLAARASADAGDYASVSRILVNHFGAFLYRPATNLPADFWQLVYPRPFWPEVSGAARRAGIDPLLLYALMRQESRFDPQARSPVGAVGLFQIMPYTAEALADAAGVAQVIADGTVDEAVLTQPAVNAAVAAQLNARLLTLFDGSLAPVVASYNAGEERVSLWWAAARGLPEDVFVDSIPYSETRRFAREVLTNYDAYRRVYEDQ